MSTQWYERQECRDRLTVFGQAIQGPFPYDIIIQPNIHMRRSAYCNFYTQEIAVNPIFFPGSPSEQYLLTKALLVHEAGHKRHTTPQELSPLVAFVSNVLEDERIERLMCREFPGVESLINRLAMKFYEKTKVIDENSDSPGEVILYFLQLRWTTKLNRPMKGALSAKNMGLRDEVSSLVFRAWEAEHSETVDQIAAEMVERLGLEATAAQRPNGNAS